MVYGVKEKAVCPSTSAPKDCVMKPETSASMLPSRKSRVQQGTAEQEPSPAQELELEQVSHQVTGSTEPFPAETPKPAELEKSQGIDSGKRGALFNFAVIVVALAIACVLVVVLETLLTGLKDILAREQRSRGSAATPSTVPSLTKTE
nr:uncharacterized protein LOC129381860 [Dermacentor andersoni]